MDDFSYRMGGPIAATGWMDNSSYMMDGWITAATGWVVDSSYRMGG